MIGNVSEKVSKLDGFVKRLEEEMRKIDAFKRELPLCMLLLNDGWSSYIFILEYFKSLMGCFQMYDFDCLVLLTDVFIIEKSNFLAGFLLFKGN